MATAIPTPPYLAGDTDHPDYHQALYEVLAGTSAFRDVAAFASLQAAHDDLPAGGGTLWFPPGFQVTVTAATSISKPCLLIGGVGSKITHGNAGTDATTFDIFSVAATTRFGISGIEFDGRYPTRTASGALVRFNGASSNVAIVDNYIHDVHGTFAFSSSSDHSNVRIIRNRIVNSAFGGLSFEGRLSMAWIEDNVIDTTQDAGIFFGNPGAGNKQTDITVARNKIRNPQRQGGAGKAGIQTAGTGSASEEWHTRFKIFENDIISTTQVGDLVGIGLDQINDSHIAGNHVTNVPAGGPGADSEGIVVCGPRNKVCNNHIKYAEAGGVALLSYGNGCQIKDVTVCCNTIEANNAASGQGINWVATNSAGNAVTGLLIMGNRIFRCGHGIQTYNNGGTLAGSNNFVVGNNLAGNVTGAASFVAGSGQVTAANNPTI